MISFSKHALERIKIREIPINLAEKVLKEPQQIIDKGLHKKIYQSIFEFENKKSYLLRLFIIIDEEPNMVTTIYKTSKISKYWKQQ